MKKKEMLGNLPKASLQEAFKCSMCLHHRKHAHSDHTKVCAEEGIKGTAIAPRCFTPDFTQVAGNTDQFVQIAMLFDSLRPNQRKIMLGMLRQASKSKKREFSFGTKVWFLMHGKDFLSNYYFAYVMGYTSAGEMVLSGSPNVKARGASFLYYSKDPEGLLTEPQWEAKRKELVAAGKLVDPTTRKIKISDPEHHKAYSIDSPPPEHGTKKRRRKGSGTQPLEFQV